MRRHECLFLRGSETSKGEPPERTVSATADSNKRAERTIEQVRVSLMTRDIPLKGKALRLERRGRNGFERQTNKHAQRRSEEQESGGRGRTEKTAIDRRIRRAPAEERIWTLEPSSSSSSFSVVKENKLPLRSFLFSSPELIRRRWFRILVGVICSSRCVRYPLYGLLGEVDLIGRRQWFAGLVVLVSAQRIVG